MRTSGNLWLYVRPKEGGDKALERLVNVAHIAELCEIKGEGCEIIFAHGGTLLIADDYLDLITRMSNPIGEGRVEVAFSADLEG